MRSTSTPGTRVAEHDVARLVLPGLDAKTFAAAQEGMQNGWTGTLDQLAEYLRRA
jgi:uncharacterized protein YndB with AHSA1/START domain